MAAEIATQLITVGATLGGVVLTLVTNAYLERGRARDTRALESLRAATQHATWLREERTKAYAGFSTAGEEVLVFIRADLLELTGHAGTGRLGEAEIKWQGLRTELRKAYNQVALFGAADARAAAAVVWRTARNGASDLLREMGSGAHAAPGAPGLAERVAAVVSDLGAAGGRFMDACREDLQG